MFVQASKSEDASLLRNRINYDLSKFYSTDPISSSGFVLISKHSLAQTLKLKPGTPYWKGSVSTVDLLALTSSDQLLIKLQKLFTILQNKLSYCGGQLYCALSLSVSVPCSNEPKNVLTVVFTLLILFRDISGRAFLDRYEARRPEINVKTNSQSCPW